MRRVLANLSRHSGYQRVRQIPQASAGDQISGSRALQAAVQAFCCSEIISFVQLGCGRIPPLAHITHIAGLKGEQGAVETESSAKQEKT